MTAPRPNRYDWPGWIPEMPVEPPEQPSHAPATDARPAHRATVVAVLVAAMIGSGIVGGLAARLSEPPAPASGSAAPPPAAPAQPAVDFGQVYERIAPAVVQLVTSGASGVEGAGSGVVVDTAGIIVTSDHVATTEDVDVILADGRRLSATVLGRDRDADTAVLQLRDPPADLVAAPLGDSDAVTPGDPVAAIGSPFGLRNSVSVGVVSGVNRTFSTGFSRPPLRGLIQTDAAVNPGNSGGPLINAAGEVIGINVAIESPVRGSVGVGFAVPINQVRDALPRLRSGDPVERPFLGIEGREGPGGVEIITVIPGSSAHAAGLRAGDVILSLEGHPTPTIDDISAQLVRRDVGDRVRVTIMRDGRMQAIDVELKRNGG